MIESYMKKTKEYKKCSKYNNNLTIISDENNKFKNGDKVSIIESKPYSKNKKFEVMEKNK